MGKKPLICSSPSVPPHSQSTIEDVEGQPICGETPPLDDALIALVRPLGDVGVAPLAPVAARWLTDAAVANVPAAVLVLGTILGLVDALAAAVSVVSETSVRGVAPREATALRARAGAMRACRRAIPVFRASLSVYGARKHVDDSARSPENRSTSQGRMPSRTDEGLDATAPCCTRPATDPWEETLPNGRRVTHYPPGPTGGEMRSFRDQDTGEIHYTECTRRGVDGSQNADGTEGTLPDAVRPFPTESFLNLDHTAAYLGKKRSTIYAWAAYLESADKIGANLIFWTESLMNDDIPELENRLPRRSAIVRERFERRASGEVLRRGRHSLGCPKDHHGCCDGLSRSDTPHRRSQKWRRDLGRNRKK